MAQTAVEPVSGTNTVEWVDYRHRDLMHTLAGEVYAVASGAPMGEDRLGDVVKAVA